MTTAQQQHEDMAPLQRNHNQDDDDKNKSKSTTTQQQQQQDDEEEDEDYVGVLLLVFGTTLVRANPNDECLIEEKPMEPLPLMPTLVYSLTATSTTNVNRMRNELNAMVQQQQPQQDSANTNQNNVLLLAVYFDETTQTFSIHAVFLDCTVVVPKLDQWMQFATFGTFAILDGSETARQAITNKGLTAKLATLDKGMERALLCCDIDAEDGDSGLEPHTRWLHGTHNDNERCDPADHATPLRNKPFGPHQFIYFFFDTTVPGYGASIALLTLLFALILFFVLLSTVAWPRALALSGFCVPPS